MSTTNITIRMDTEIKKQAEELFADLGLNLTTAFNVFAKQAIREQRLPFIISKSHNLETIQTIEDSRNRINLSRSFNSVSELMEDLDADD